MAFTELYVQATDGVATNGGSSTSPRIAIADATVAGGTPTIITDNGAFPWAACNAGDWLCWDTGGAPKEWRRITSINDHEATVDRACTAGANKLVSVGGPWAKPSQATAMLNTQGAATWPAAVVALPPRVNVAYQAGVAYADAQPCYLTSTWTDAIPVTLEGYSAIAGDLNSGTSTVRPVINGDSQAIRTTTGHAFFRNLYVDAGAGYVTFGCTHTHFENCKLTSNIAAQMVGYASDVANTYRRCEFINASVAANAVALYLYSSQAIGCTIKGGNIGVLLDRNSSIVDCHQFGAVIGVSANGGSYPIVIVHDTIADNSGAGISIVMTVPIGFLLIQGNLVAYNAGHGMTYIGAGGPMFVAQDFNAFYANNGGAAPADIDTGTIVDISQNNLALAADPFVHAGATGDAGGGVYRMANCDYAIVVTSAVVDADLGVPPQGTTYMESHGAIGALQFTMAQGTYPLAADVDIDDVAYGPTGAEYAGALEAGGGVVVVSGGMDGGLG